MSSYKRIEKLYLTIWFVLTICLILTDSYTFLYLSILLILSLILFLNNQNLIFELFLLTTVCWGASLNLEYRLGNIMTSDISLAVLFLSLLANKATRNSFSKRYALIAEFLALWLAVFGFARGYLISNILQDLKLFLYIFIPFIFLANTNYIRLCYRRLGFIVKVYAILIFIMEITHLLEIGLQTMVANGFGNRDVAIIIQFVPLVACLSLYSKSKKEKFIFSILCACACLISFTRTIWISYLLGIFCTLLLGSRNYRNNLKKTTLFIIGSLVLIIILSFIMPSFFNDIFNAIYSRIFNTTNKVNTLSVRFSQSASLFDSKILRPITLVGAGFGDYSEIKNSVFVENSFLYYIWKYGVFCALFLFYKAFICLWHAFKYGNSIVRIISINLTIFIVIGSLSGNCNLYYCMPSLSFVFAYPFIKNSYRGERINEGVIPFTS